MKMLVEAGSTQAGLAAVSNRSSKPSQNVLPVWDRRTWLVAIPLAVLVLYAFIPTLANDFVAWDDDVNFLENPYYRGLGIAQMKWAWTTFWVGAYQPLGWLLLEAQYVFCQLSPRGYHLTSLFFQVANAIVLYVLTMALFVRCRPDSCLKNPWASSLSAGLVTALFAVHPLRVEAVAWVSCQSYLPCAFFSMLSVLAYLRAFATDSSPRWGWLMASFFLFVMALLFKAVAVSLPAILLILDVYPLRRFPDGTGRWLGTSARRALWEKVPFVVVSLIFMGLAIAAKPDSQFPVVHYGTWDGIARACYATWFYILKTVLPIDLIALYRSPIELQWGTALLGSSIVATVAVSAGLFLLRRRWPGLLAAWLSYLVILAPNSGIIRISEQPADRYSYISMLGLFMVVAPGVCWLWRMSVRWHPAAAITIVATGLAALLVLTTLTRSQCRTWLNSRALWTHALNHGGNSSDLVQYWMGITFHATGNYQAAAAHYAEALRLNPDFARAHSNLGNILSAQGKHQAAAAHFAEALRFNPGDYRTHNNLGKILFRGGKEEEAAAHFKEALRLNPDYVDAHNNLGAVLLMEGKPKEAIRHFTEALRVDPDSAAAHNNLGLALQAQGNYPAAVKRPYHEDASWGAR